MGDNLSSQEVLTRLSKARLVEFGRLLIADRGAAWSRLSERRTMVEFGLVGYSFATSVSEPGS